MSFVLPMPPVPAVPVEGGTGGELFAVRRIYCVGRNYVEHAIEMGHSGREAPFFFLKPADAVLPVAEGQVGTMQYPTLTSSLHHEVELVVAIGKGGRDILAADATKHVWGYAVGLDMTRRDLQGEAKKLGRPWDTGKAFDHSAPCSAIRRASEIGHPAKGRIWLDVNGKLRQESDLTALIWKVPETIAFLSTLFALMPGDLIYSGTPAGVAAVQRGDTLSGGVDGVGTISFKVT